MTAAVVYARYSSHAQNEQSIEGQLAYCYDFAKKQGYTIIGEYIDRALTGKTDDRPQFQKMLNDSAEKHFSAVLVYQLDRFSRNRYDSAVHKQRLKKNGVKVVSVRENITDDASGVLMEALLEGIAEYYSVELSQKVKRGMDLNGAKCLTTGGRIALGFKVGSDKKFQIDEQTAPIVEKIFTMYASGFKVSEIIAELNRLNYKTSSGAAFNKNSLHRLLCNKRYIGIYTYKGTDTPDGIPRIISDDLFYKVQEIMKMNKKAPARSRSKEDYLLTTKLFCGKCKNMMSGMSGTSKNGVKHCYYTCNGRKTVKCDKHNVNKEWIENAVISLAKAQLTNENIDRISKAVVAACEKERQNGDYARLEKALAENEKQKANLIAALKYGKAVNTIVAEIEKLDAESDDLNRELILERVKNYDVTEEQIKFFLSKLRECDIEDINYRRVIITVLVNAVYLYDDNYTVIFNSSDRPVEVTESLLSDIEKCSRLGNNCLPSVSLYEPAPFGLNITARFFIHTHFINRFFFKHASYDIIALVNKRLSRKICVN